jgi:cell division inhibitor SulA
MPLSTGSSSGDGALPDWQQVQTLRVADVVMTILKARKAMPSATAAAVSRARHGGGYRVLVSLLEDGAEEEAADLGVAVDRAAAVFVARELGQDLADAFGDKDVFILQ